jgi:putative acyl-CoA dehydrogenase
MIATTHAVTNQPPALENYNAYRTDGALVDSMARFGLQAQEARLDALGALAGGEAIALGFAANENRPTFKPFDRFGHRIDRVEFHAAYHRLMEIGIGHGVANHTWVHAGTPGANVVRAALMYLNSQPDQGTSCPITMTYAAFPLLARFAPAPWKDRVLAGCYDPRELPAEAKAGITIGMGMTEKQGGSDVRSNTTRAVPVDGEGWHELTGHKWFFSAPMCDAHLVLAQAPGGLSCFLLPRILPDGGLNAVRIQRLKDKLGDWSNASSEVEFHGARALSIGEPGRGIATILEMVALTRQDCMIGSAAIMRQALVQAIHHARHRSAFGRPLLAHPLMLNVLADLALESESMLMLTLRVADAIDRAPREADAAALARIATAIGKYFVCKRCVPFVNEAQECLGGAGYVEESNLPRLYRQAPLNSIWEGSGNIQCLDVLRALARDPDCGAALQKELLSVQGECVALDEWNSATRKAIESGEPQEARARWIVERLALGLIAVQWIRSGQTAFADLFVATRLTERALTFGTLPAYAPMQALVERGFPA